jgi:aminopeptidase YwaD
VCHMRTRVFIFLLLAKASAWAQDTSYAHKVLYELCSEKYHGRGYYKNGEEKAGKYIAKEMKKLGLKPSNNGSFYQKFDLNGNQINKAELKINGQIIPLGSAWLPSPNMDENVTIIYSAFDWLTIDTGMTISDLKKSVGNITGVLFVDTLAPGCKISQRDILNAVKGTGVSTVVFMTANDFNYNVSDGSNSSQDFTICYKYLPKELRNIKKWNKVEMHAKAKVKKHKLCNVLGTIEGKNTDSTIIICAHYDHLGQVGKDAIFYGANDNACGIAMLLDLARYYKENKPTYNIMFIAFAAEEAGLIGSNVYINNPVVPLSRTKFVLNLDLVGTGQTGATVVNATIFPDEYAKLVAVNNKGGFIPALHRRGKAANSDHYWFTEKGIPSFFIYFEGTRSSYHDVFDIPETLPLVKFMDGRNLFIQFVNSL